MTAREDYPYWPAPADRRFSAEGAWHWSRAMDEIDVLRATADHLITERDSMRAEVQAMAEHPVAEYPHELLCPSIDVCAICADSECDGIQCITDIDPNNSDDQPHLEQLQAWVRLGRIQEQATAFLAVVENRS